MQDTQFEPGDIVDIEVKGACVINSFTTGIVAVDGKKTDTGTILVFRHPGEDGMKERSHSVNLGREGVTVTLAAPAEWPPQVGDLWQDRMGTLWFAHNLGGSQIGFVPDDYAPDEMTPAAVLEGCGPLTLVRRDIVKEAG